MLIAAVIFLSGNYVAPIAQTTCGSGTTAVSNVDGTTTCVSDSGPVNDSSSPTVIITQDQPVPVGFNVPFYLGERFHHVR